MILSFSTGLARKMAMALNLSGLSDRALEDLASIPNVGFVLDLLNWYLQGICSNGKRLFCYSFLADVLRLASTFLAVSC